MRTDRTTSTEARSTSLRSELTIESVTHAYGRKIVLSQASLRTRPGEVHCLLGPSGSGKTTLLRLVAGLEELQEGRIAFGPEEVATPDRHIPPEARAVGLVFQDYALFPHLDVRANVAFGLAYEKRSVRLERVRSLLAAVGM
ncbi:MAG TPA: ATP-binding cassette domain-containing protein, partial [Planctomycetota bacterium]|nr:ATP-binding cassette domain-containing protein [Planctomycetota bacterium]